MTSILTGVLQNFATRLVQQRLHRPGGNMLRIGTTTARTNSRKAKQASSRLLREDALEEGGGVRRQQLRGHGNQRRLTLLGQRGDAVYNRSAERESNQARRQRTHTAGSGQYIRWQT